MTLTKSVKVLAASLLLTVGAANAATYSLTGLQEGPLKNPGSFDTTFYSDVADTFAKLDFVIQGYKTLDGNNGYKDLFTLTINDQVFSGSFNLGGGGSSDTSFGGAPAVTLNPVAGDPGTGIGGNGGTTTVTGLNFNLKQGTNKFTFAYTAPGASNGSGQSIGDEAWGIKSASVTAVPEPETYAMMLAGLGLMGAIARRRKAKQA